MAKERNIFDAMSILSRNADKNFVQRVLRPDQNPKLDNRDAAGNIVSQSTHSMSAEVDADGNWFVFPTVVQGPSGDLQRLELRDAQKYAKETGERIGFGKDKDAAIWFSSDDGYKQVWKVE